MELIIVVLLLVIIYQLHKNSEKSSGPAFTKEEWDKAVCDWYEKDFSDYGHAPLYRPWTPPPYEEVKDNPEALKTLREMSGKRR